MYKSNETSILQVPEHNAPEN